MFKKFKALKIILIILLLCAASYVAYVFISYHRVEDNFPLHSSGTAPSGDTIPVNRQEPFKITSWNIGFGAYTSDFSFFMDGGKHSRAFSEEAVWENITAMGNKLKELNSDFYFVQEVDIDSDRAHHVNQKQALLNIFSGLPANDTDNNGEEKAISHTFAVNYDSPYLFYPLTEPHGKTLAGLLTMSEYRINDGLRRSLPIQTDFAKFIDLDRCYAINRIKADNGKELVLINFHLSAYTTDPSIANQQLEMMYEDMEAELKKGNYVICGGDFNKDLLGDSSKYFGISGENYSWAQSFPFESLPQGFSLAAPFDENNPVPSCRNADMEWDPEKNFQLTIDGFIISDNIDVVSCDVLDENFKYSDHNPVHLEFRLK